RRVDQSSKMRDNRRVGFELLNFREIVKGARPAAHCVPGGGPVEPGVYKIRPAHYCVRIAIDSLCMLPAIKLNGTQVIPGIRETAVEHQRLPEKTLRLIRIVALDHFVAA